LRGGDIALPNTAAAIALAPSWLAASTKHRHRRPERGTSSLMVSNDRDDRADAHELLR
jgi:hypothetical protein